MPKWVYKYSTMSKRHSISFRAALFVGAVCASLIAIDAWHSWSARGQRLAEAERDAFNLARSMAQQADDTIKAADTCLADLVERIETDGLGPAQTSRIHLQMVNQVDNLPQLAGLFVFDDSGRWVVNSRPVLLPGPTNDDREYFIYHKQHNSRKTYVGMPVISRSSGRWIVPVSRRLNQADGSFGGVVLATLDMGYFRRFYQSFDIGEQGAVALLSNDGVLMLRRPFNDAAIGHDGSRSEVFQAYRENSIGSGVFASPQDGEVRLNSYRPLQHYPLWVSAALSKDEVLAPWRRDTALHSLGVLALAALLGFFGRRLVGQIDLRVKTETELVEAREALDSANRLLEQQTSLCDLSGLAKREQLDLMLDNEFGRALRHQTSLALLLVDVDYLQRYNHAHGSAAGDDCLRAVCKLIRALTPRRPGDLAARYSGGQVAVLLPNTDNSGALAVAQRIRSAIENMQLPHGGSPYGQVTVSVGAAALVPQRGQHAVSTLVTQAAAALRHAKSAGRNRVCTSDDCPAEPVETQPAHAAAPAAASAPSTPDAADAQA